MAWAFDKLRINEFKAKHTIKVAPIITRSSIHKTTKLILQFFSFLQISYNSLLNKYCTDSFFSINLHQSIRVHTKTLLTHFGNNEFVDNFENVAVDFWRRMNPKINLLDLSLLESCLNSDKWMYMYYLSSHNACHYLWLGVSNSLSVFMLLR